MYNKKKKNSRSKRLSKKASQRTTTEQRKATKANATPAITSVSRIVDLLKPWELNPSNRFTTYQTMLQNNDVWSSIESRITSIEVSQTRPKLKYNRFSERSTWLRDFIYYNLHAMKKSTRQIGRDAAEMVYNGVAPFEVNTKIEKDYEEYKGLFVLDDIIYIDPLTLDKRQPFVSKKEGSEIAYWKQLSSAFIDSDGCNIYKDKFKDGGFAKIDARKVAVSSYSASSSRILGSSILDSAYATWREMILLQEYLLMGVQKDLSGTPVLRVPLDLFEKANSDPDGDAAATMAQLTEAMGNMHSGSDAFAILPSDPFDSATSMEQYSMEFLGINGSNKNFDLVAIIEQKKKGIYNVLGASHLIAGENGGGSFNLFEGKSNTSAFYALRDANIVDEMYNQVIIPMILRLNGFTNEKVEDIPVYEHNEIQPLSADEQGKLGQRLGSVGMLPLTPAVVNHFLDVAGINERVDDNMSTEELREIMTNYVSNAGEGDGTSGTGDSQSAGSNSSLNSENAS